MAGSDGRFAGGGYNFEKGAWDQQQRRDLADAIRALQFGVNAAQLPPDLPTQINASDDAAVGEGQGAANSAHTHSVLVGTPSVPVTVGGSPSQGTGGALMLATAGLVLDPETLIFTQSYVFVAPAGALDVPIFLAPFNCTVTAVKARRIAGTGAVINARRNGTAEHLSVDLSLTTTAWTDGGAVQNTAYVTGDGLEARLKSVAGAPTLVVVQVNYKRA